MKSFLLAAGVVLLVALLALARTFSAENLPVPADFAVSIPSANPPPDLSIAALSTGTLNSQAAFAFRGGAFDDERIFAMSPVLVRHPQGLLLIDAGFGRNVDAHFQTTQFLMRALSVYNQESAVADQLTAAGVDPQQLKGVVLTHAHWDHVSGVEDLLNVPIWVTNAEREFIRDCGEHTALICSFNELRYRIYDFPDGPYLGFESSYDVFADGSVVLVPTPGHTPGSVTVFVTLASGRRYAFIGDIAWQNEGVDLPAERPWLPRKMLEEDGAAVRRWLVHFKQLQQAVPDLIIVPAHDRRVFDTLPTLKPSSETRS